MSVAEDSLLVRAGWVGAVRAVLDAELLPPLVRQMLNNQSTHTSRANPTMDAAQAPAHGAFGTRAFMRVSDMYYLIIQCPAPPCVGLVFLFCRISHLSHIEALLHASALCSGLQQ